MQIIVQLRNAIGIIMMCCVLPCFDATISDDITYKSPTGLTCVKCSPGTYFLDHCDTNNTEAHCHLCEQGTFTSTPNIAKYCASCKTDCENQDLVPVKNCSHTTDMKCECPEGQFNLYPTMDKFHAKCREYGPCKPGYGVKTKGSSINNTMCERCRQGYTFSNTTSTVDMCQPCTQCGKLGLIQKCNLVQDRICAKHSPGSPREHADTDEVVKDALAIITPVLVFVCAVAVGWFTCYLREKKMYCFKEAPADDKTRHDSIHTPSDIDEKMPPIAIIPSPASDLIHIPQPANSPPHTANSLPPIASLTLSLTDTQKIPHVGDADWGSSFSPIINRLIDLLIPLHSWKGFVRTLYNVSELKSADARIIEATTNNQNNLKEQIYQCCSSWKTTAGKRASPQQLLHALNQADVYSTIRETLRREYPDVFRPMESSV